MFGGIGVGEVLLIVGAIVLVFGAKRIPMIARGLGEGIRNFKGGLKDDTPKLGADDREDRRSGDRD
jgi:sec-independent protein translocase protein TatA